MTTLDDEFGIVNTCNLPSGVRRYLKRHTSLVPALKQLETTSGEDLITLADACFKKSITSPGFHGIAIQPDGSALLFLDLRGCLVVASECAVVPEIAPAPETLLQLNTALRRVDLSQPWLFHRIIISSSLNDDFKIITSELLVAGVLTITNDFFQRGSTGVLHVGLPILWPVDGSDTPLVVATASASKVTELVSVVEEMVSKLSKNKLFASLKVDKGTSPRVSLAQKKPESDASLTAIAEAVKAQDWMGVTVLDNEATAQPFQSIPGLDLRSRAIYNIECSTDLLEKLGTSRESLTVIKPKFGPLVKSSHISKIARSFVSSSRDLLFIGGSADDLKILSN